MLLSENESSNRFLSAVFSHSMVIIYCGALAAMLSEGIMVTAHYCHRNFAHQFNLLHFTMDTLLAPSLGVVFSNQLFSRYNHLFKGKDWLSNTNTAVLMTLVLRHLIKKLWSYPTVQTGAGLVREHGYSFFNRCGNSLQAARRRGAEMRTGLCCDRVAETEEEKEEEKRGLLSSAVSTAVTGSVQAGERAASRPLSMFERLTGYVSSWSPRIWTSRPVTVSTVPSLATDRRATGAVPGAV